MASADMKLAQPFFSEAGAESAQRCSELGGSGTVVPSAKTSAHIQEGQDTESLARAVASGACRAALQRSPAMCRAALAKHRAHIDPALSKILDIVGSYEGKYGRSPLHEAARLGDVETLQFLLLSRVRLASRHRDLEGSTAEDLATEDCRALLDQHYAARDYLDWHVCDMVPAIIAYWTNGGVPEESMPVANNFDYVTDESSTMPILSLRAYHFHDPSFFWAPYNVRSSIFAWAQDVFAAQLVALSEPFEELPDDCASDVWEYLIEKSITRIEMQHILRHCSSPEALAWIRAVVAAAYAANTAAHAATPLRKAVLIGDLATVEDCIVQCADLELRDRVELFPRESGLRPCFCSGFYGMEDKSIKDKDKWSALMRATANGHSDIVRLLLEAGADPETMDDDHNGVTVLHRAASDNRDLIVTFLLKAGANQDAKSHDGATPLVNASVNGHAGIVEILLQGGANVDIVNLHGDTALACAAFAGHATVVELLLRPGAHLEAKNNHGDTALMYASYEGHAKVVKLLLEADADIQARNNVGDAALMYASREGRTAVVKLLLEAGADVDAKNEYGDCAIIRASINGHDAVVELLIQAGANKETTDNFDQAPLHYAIINGHAEVVALLR